MADITLDAKQVCARMQRSIMWWYRNRKRLEREGFPKPVPGFKHLWSADAVDAWINGIGSKPGNENKEPKGGQEDWEAKLLGRLPAAAAEVSRRRA